MRKLKSSFYVFLTVVLTGCGGVNFNTAPGGTAIKKNQPSAALEVPPDLLNTTSEEITSAKAELEAEQTQEVLPESYLTELIEDGDQHWLEIQARPQDVWERMLAYWQSLGIGLVVNSPQTGVMETGWIAPERRPGVLAAMFAGANDSGYDKFTIRLERADNSYTRLYVDHRWAQKILVNFALKDSEAEWVETEDPEKELELLKAVAYEMDPSNILGG